MNSIPRMTESERRAATEVLKALAHPVRLGIVEHLADRKIPCAELRRLLGCSQPTLSQQLKMLEQQGLVAIRRDGVRKVCELRNRDFLKVFACMSRHLREVLPARASATEETR
jgi:DNA-binding transcriptional ArsR family regulator